jgi:hypothetical protein
MRVPDLNLFKVARHGAFLSAVLTSSTVTEPMGALSMEGKRTGSCPQHLFPCLDGVGGLWWRTGALR